MTQDMMHSKHATLLAASLVLLQETRFLNRIRCFHHRADNGLKENT